MGEYRYCTKCGNALQPEMKFCNVCGKVVPNFEEPKDTVAEENKPEAPTDTAAEAEDSREETKPEAPNDTVAEAESNSEAAPGPVEEPKESNVQPQKAEVPEANRPVGMWGYFGLEILLLVPVIGFILTFVLAFAPKNINVKNFVRSRFCYWIIISIPYIALIVIMLLTQTSFNGLLQHITESEWYSNIADKFLQILGK